VLVHPDTGGINHLHRRVMTGSKRIHDPVPDASPPPPNEAIVTSGAGTIGFREVAPFNPNGKTRAAGCLRDVVGQPTAVPKSKSFCSLWWKCNRQGGRTAAIIHIDFWADLMKNVAITIVAVAALIGTPALAADMAIKAQPPAPAPVYSWTEWYVGVNAGGHWGNVSDPAVFTQNTWFGGVDAANAAAAWPNTLKPSGFAGGGQLGYNWQAPNSNFLLGFEADIDGLTGKASRNVVFSINGGPGGSNVGDSARDNWIATVRGRAGFIFNQALLYATGGAAFSNWSMNHTYSDNAGAVPTNITNSSTRSGWTIGGGLEYAFLNNWTARAEYLYADFGTFNNSLSMQNFGIGFTVLHPEKLTENILRVGLNYQFH
jgi:outer membrane immunogenic protein